MAKTNKEFEAEQDANTLLEAKRINDSPGLKKAALKVIRKRQNIATKVLKGV